MVLDSWVSNSSISLIFLIESSNSVISPFFFMLWFFPWCFFQSCTRNSSASLISLFDFEIWQPEWVFQNLHFHETTSSFRSIALIRLGFGEITITTLLHDLGVHLIMAIIDIGSYLKTDLLHHSPLWNIIPNVQIRNSLGFLCANLSVLVPLGDSFPFGSIG
jgi:hypothetical protein